MSRQYPNEIIDRANQFHGYNFVLSPDPIPVASFAPQPSDYTFVLGEGDTYEFEEPARQDGRSVYSRVITEYSDANDVLGEAISSESTNLAVYSPVQLANPSFDVNVANWTAGTGTLVRDTVVFDTSPASGRLTSDGATGYARSFSDFITLDPAQTYRAVISMRREAAVTYADSFGGLYVNARQNYTVPNIMDYAAGVFNTYSIDFKPALNGQARIMCGFYGPVAATVLAYIDSITIYSLTGTIISRRGFTRDALRPMDSKSTAAAAAAIANLELAASQYPPLKGTIKVSGRIPVKGGDTWPVSRLPSSVGKALLIQNLRDFNTGAFGRQGIIKTASYEAATDTATCTIDDPANFIVNLRARLAAIR